MHDYHITEIGFEIFNFKCFDESGSGSITLRPINFVIGRNNAGKSAVVDFINFFLIKGEQNYDNQPHSRGGIATSFHLSHKLFEDDLRQIFHENSSGGALKHNHWAVGKTLINGAVTFLDGHGATRSIVSLENPGGLHADVLEAASNAILSRVRWPITGWGITRVAAERDVQPEPMVAGQDIQPNGLGLTNAVMRQINDSSRQREVIEERVLTDLNEIYQGDATFTDIITRIDVQNNWEIYLREQDKGDIRLSESGSGLKTALLIATLIRLRSPAGWSRHIFAIDEPENNLHPALFRRLLEYLARMRDELGFVLLVTTHSPIGIDWAARRLDSQVLHTTHNGIRAKVVVADGYSAGRKILDDLDIKASDLLQANGIIWVEGPSDRIYLRRWLDLYSDNSLKEGIHYTIMFYGGKLLSHLTGNSPDEEVELIALLAMNRNAALIIDSDRRPEGTAKNGKVRRPRMNINETKKRIKAELEAHDGLVWITAGKEMENYIPVEVLAKLVGQPAPAVGEYDTIVELPLLKTFNGDKVKLAHAVCAILEHQDITRILDLEEQLLKICTRIRSWNGSSLSS